MSDLFLIYSTYMVIRLSKHCAQCGIIFYKLPSNSMFAWENKIKYCSRICYAKAETKSATKTCPICKKLFKSKVWSTKAIYCSRKCSSISQQKPLPNCELCGEPCTKHCRRFCSRSCKIKWYRRENVYNYLGEDVKRSYPVDLIFWMKRAKEIRERDKVCQHCGKTPEQNKRALDIHHIIPYRISKDNSPSNLIALCRVCHKKADHKLNGHKMTAI